MQRAPKIAETHVLINQLMYKRKPARNTFRFFIDRNMIYLTRLILISCQQVLVSIVWQLLHAHWLETSSPPLTRPMTRTWTMTMTRTRTSRSHLLHIIIAFFCPIMIIVYCERVQVPLVPFHHEVLENCSCCGPLC